MKDYYPTIIRRVLATNEAGDSLTELETAHLCNAIIAALTECDTASAAIAALKYAEETAEGDYNEAMTHIRVKRCQVQAKCKHPVVTRRTGITSGNEVDICDVCKAKI